MITPKLVSRLLLAGRWSNGAKAFFSNPAIHPSIHPFYPFSSLRPDSPFISSSFVLSLSHSPHLHTPFLPLDSFLNPFLFVQLCSSIPCLVPLCLILTLSISPLFCISILSLSHSQKDIGCTRWWDILYVNEVSIRIFFLIWKCVWHLLKDFFSQRAYHYIN